MKVLTIYIRRRSRQMAFPVLMSAGKVQYFCHLPLLWVHYNKKEASNSVFICLSIRKLHFGQSDHALASIE